MAKMTKERLQVAVLCVILALLAAIGGYQFVWRPLTTKMGNLRPQSARLTTDLEALKRQLNRLPELEQTVAGQRTTSAALEAHLSKRVAIDTLLADLSSMANEAQVRIESLEPLNAAPKEAKDAKDAKGSMDNANGVYAEIPIQISARGGFHQLGAFINALEEHPRLMRLTRLEMTGDEKTPLLQSAELIVSTFRLLDSGEAAP